MNENAVFGGSRGEAYRRRPARAVSAEKSRTSRGGDPEIPSPYHFLQSPPKQPIHRPPPTRVKLASATPTPQLASTGVERRRSLPRLPHKRSAEFKQTPFATASRRGRIAGLGKRFCLLHDK